MIFYIEMVKEEENGPYDANKFFYILKLALDVRNNKLMVHILNYIQKLISYEFLDGN